MCVCVCTFSTPHAQLLVLTEPTHTREKQWVDRAGLKREEEEAIRTIMRAPLQHACTGPEPGTWSTSPLERLSLLSLNHLAARNPPIFHVTQTTHTHTHTLLQTNRSIQPGVRGQTLSKRLILLEVVFKWPLAGGFGGGSPLRLGLSYKGCLIAKYAPSLVDFWSEEKRSSATALKKENYAHLSSAPDSTGKPYEYSWPGLQP